MMHGDRDLPMTMIEEQFDEEDLQEKAMIGNLLKREYERGISECASNAGGNKKSSSKRNSQQFEHNEEQDLTQSLLSANSTKEPQYSLLEAPQD